MIEKNIGKNESFVWMVLTVMVLTDDGFNTLCPYKQALLHVLILAINECSRNMKIQKLKKLTVKVSNVVV